MRVLKIRTTRFVYLCLEEIRIVSYSINRHDSTSTTSLANTIHKTAHFETFTFCHFRALVLSRGSLFRFSIGNKQWRKANRGTKGTSKRSTRYMPDSRYCRRSFFFSTAEYAVVYRAVASRRHRS